MSVTLLLNPNLIIKIPYFWSYDTFWSEIVLQNGILIFFYSIAVDKNTSRAMSLGFMTSTVFVWSNTANNYHRLCFPFIGYYCPLESRNAKILHRSGQVFFFMLGSSSNLYDTTMEHRILWWNLCCFEWQVRVTEWFTQWMFGFWFSIMNYLSPETKKNGGKKVASSLPLAPKQTSQNLSYFKTYASELPFSHFVPVPS